MKVSVVIPVYNEEKYIKNCLESLMKQEEKPDEIIVVDNNCTDETINIVKKYGKIYHDGNIIIASSARRIINNPLSFFGEYNIRFFKMFYSHRHLV